MLHAHQIAQEIASGKISAHEAVAECVERIESTHRALNAVVVPRFEEALKEAALADAARTRGEALGPIHGVPITIKESFDLAGTATTAGLTNRAGHRAVNDAWVVERLRRAGAIVLGKTNVSQLLLHDSCSNPLYGQTNNPWRLDRSPGASSGGEAAILAVGGSALGIGSDIGGSVRLPADACGVNSLKPTSGRLPLDGHISFFPHGESMMCQPGPMARSVADLTLAMRVLTGTAQQPPWENLKPDGLRDIRIGFYTDNGVITPSPAIRNAVNAAARALEARGLPVTDWQPPNVDLMWRVGQGLLLSEGLSKVRQVSRGSKLSANVRRVLAFGKIPKAAFSVGTRILRVAGQHRLAESAACFAEPNAQLHQRRIELCNAFITAMDVARIDAIVCPIFAVPAVRRPMKMAINEALSYSAIYNFLGMPAGVVAATRVTSNAESDRRRSLNLVERAARQIESGSAGLPVGIQVVARHWREDIVLGIMSALEEHFRPQPGYPADPPAS